MNHKENASFLLLKFVYLPQNYKESNEDDLSCSNHIFIQPLLIDSALSTSLKE